MKVELVKCDNFAKNHLRFEDQINGEPYFVFVPSHNMQVEEAWSIATNAFARKREQLAD